MSQKQQLTFIIKFLEYIVWITHSLFEQRSLADDNLE